MSYCSHRVLIPIALCLLWGGFPCGTVAQTQQLTDDGTMKFTPTFFRNDNELAFVQFVKPTLFQIMSLKLDDLSVRPLHKDESNHELDVAISPDGAYYAYIKCHGTLTGSIEILDANHNQIGTVPPGEGFGFYRSLAFAPNNSRLLFSYPEEVHQQLFSVGLKGGNRQQLTNSSGINNWPCFSPDGSLLAVGSAAGVAVMGQARGIYTFFGHLKWTPAILLGYALSIWVHLLINSRFIGVLPGEG